MWKRWLRVPLGILSCVACGQAVTVDQAVLGPVARVSLPGEDVRQVWVYADPADGRHLIACGALSYRQANVVYGFVYSSPDGGATWHRTLLDDSSKFNSEQSCTYGQGGRAYFADGESDMSTGQPRHEWGHLQVFTSSDHGMSWQRAGNRADGWVDWTFLAAVPHPETLVIFGNAGTDRLGHWWEKHPVALETSTGAESFSSLVAPSAKSFANFGAGSVVLSDRTALFITGATNNYKDVSAAQAQIEIYGYSPSAKTLQRRAIVRTMPRGLLPSFWPALVRDAGSGSSGKRLYAAWTEFQAQGSAQLWMATSDDNGFHWWRRTVLSVSLRKGACPNDPVEVPDIRISLNRDGVLGILWRLDSKLLLFAGSRDGGRAFSTGTIVTRHDVRELALNGGVAFNEWLLAENVAVQAGRSPVGYADLQHLGLSVRLSRLSGLGDFSLTADATGTFHALWAEVDADGDHALMTRQIRAAAREHAADSLQAPDDATDACAESSEPLAPLAPGERPQEADKQDLTGLFALQVDHVEYTPGSHTVAAVVTLVNRGDKTVRGSLSLFGVGLHSDYGVAVAVNASGRTGGQPYWDLSSVIPDDGLPPKATSQPLELRFKVEQFKAVPAGDAVAMWLRVNRK